MIDVNIADLLYLFLGLCIVIVGFKLVHGIVKIVFKAIGFTILVLVLLKIFGMI